MTKVNPNDGNKTKSNTFHETNSNLTSFFIGCKILKYLSEFYTCYLSISVQK